MFQPLILIYSSGNFGHCLIPLDPCILVIMKTNDFLGFVLSLTNDLSGAVEYFHRALSLRPEDTFSTTMLNEVRTDFFFIEEKLHYFYHCVLFIRAKIQQIIPFEIAENLDIFVA